MTAVHCPLASQSQSVTVELNTYNWAPGRTAVTSRRVGASHCILGCQVLALATGYALCCGADCLIPIPDSFLRFTCQRQRLTLGSYRGIDSGLISFQQKKWKNPAFQTDCRSLDFERWHCGLPRISFQSHYIVKSYEKLSYRRGTARCVVSVEILPIATQQCRNYLYDKSWTKYQLSLIDPCNKIVLQTALDDLCDKL